MSYIGNQPATAFETVQKQISTSNSGTTITLDRAVTSVQDILLTIDAVVQSYDNYSVSGTTLTVGGTLNNNRVEILYVGRTMQSVDPTDDSVSASKIKTDAVTTAKVQNDAITVDKLNLVSTSSVPSLEAKGDGGSQDGYIQLNCSQNSHGIKIKSAPHSANASYTLTLPNNDGDANQFLQTDGNGVLSFANAGGGLIYLNGSESSSSASAVTFDNVFSSTYRAYKVIGMIAPSTDTYVKARFRSGGSDVNASTYSIMERSSHVDSSNNVGQQNSGANNQTTSFSIAAADINSDSNSDFVSFDLTFYDPNTDVFSRSMMSGTLVYRNGGSAKLYASYIGMGMHSNTNNDGIKFETNAGTLSYHSIRVYGIVNS